MLCNWCSMPIADKAANYYRHLVFHAECLWAYREYLKGLKEASDKEIRKHAN